MKGKGTEEEVLRPPTSQTKAQKRPGRAKPMFATNAAKKLCKEPNHAMPTTSSPSPSQQPNLAGAPFSPLPDEINLIFDGALEVDGWFWGAVDEEKLMGWFPFVEEDFSSFCWESRGPSGFFWEDYHDIWHLKHIHEIPNSANR